MTTTRLMATRLRAPKRVVSLAAAALATGTLVLASTGLVSPAPAQAAVAHSAAAAKVSKHLRLNAWKYAVHQRHKPYVWGGTGPGGFDCSGLVYASFRSRGVHLPRTTYGMLDSRHLIRIPKSQARRGDLAFFGSGHVELFDKGSWTYGAASPGTQIGFHKMNAFWHPTMYFRVRR